MTRRGLYHSAMAGGVANIWGHLLDSGTGGDPDIGLSHSYEHPEWIRTYATFFEQRFFADYERCNELTGGVCLRPASISPACRAPSRPWRSTRCSTTPRSIWDP